MPDHDFMLVLVIDFDFVLAALLVLVIDFDFDFDFVLAALLVLVQRMPSSSSTTWRRASTCADSPSTPSTACSNACWFWSCV